MVVRMPYGRGFLEGELPRNRIAGVITNRLGDYRPTGTQQEIVEAAVKDPIGSPSLYELAAGKKKVVIVASDHTRPVPSKIIMPILLREVRRASPQAEITILVATGCHRATGERELREKFGDDVVDTERIAVHDCTDQSNMADMGLLPSGGRLLLNRLAMEADLLLSEGFIEPHFFAGFSGGRKSVLPGIAARETVYANHCAAFIASNLARSGSLNGNPIHLDMIFAAKVAKLAFIVNVVIDAEHRVIGAFAGDCEAAHLAGCRMVEELCSAPSCPADIVLTTNNGYPLDQNIYQAVKGMSTAEVTCNEHGVIIMVAACEDGVGGEAFCNTFRSDRSSEHILEQILRVPQEETVADQWQSQIFARVLSKFHVILVSTVAPDTVRELHMLPASSIADALAQADKLLGHHNGSITVIPEGVSTIITTA